MPAMKIATTVLLSAMKRQLAGAANLLHDDSTDIHHLQVFVGTINQALVNHLPPSTQYMSIATLGLRQVSFNKSAIKITLLERSTNPTCCHQFYLSGSKVKVKYDHF